MRDLNNARLRSGRGTTHLTFISQELKGDDTGEKSTVILLDR
jgi:hypothetical protein